MLIKNLVQNAIVYTPNNGQVLVKLFYLPKFSNGSEIATPNLYASFGTHVIHSVKPYKLAGSGAQASRLVLQIMDSGRGIAATDYESVFEPFVRLSQTASNADNIIKNSTDIARSDSVTNTDIRTEKGSGVDGGSEIKGTGLGLSIVKTICQQANIDVFMSTSTLMPAPNQPASGLCITLVF